ncbi:Elongation factor P--(R)-beta-lysine ligase [Vibrio ruber DSM 16370]|uniref:Elongation factor P--(R)-beta-lysine ligase n=1 Tax=Vibrio ruber (strain DSM 16370 / JCM 11486 / BCRC 17186 / CECT 7878 / LMG 23124 / VR1) TaxID=1123498 RepID=A0A1R4LLJ2_VIBR1|nr:elongation factor P--(R)-beta-lysine ligase [Vibrio ruber]SJN57466.1 Elongation factor P--(R)-beta-lysine ligase [Vibrio ruber DSM 16370]
MANHLSWKPTISMFHLRERARFINAIRHFLTERGVLEVETPSMSLATVTDVHLQTFKSQFFGPDFASGRDVYLMTSPEFHMKRLLAAGSGSIFQLCKAFRNEESGRHHNPEFTLLEWYRVGFDHHQLMDEMDDLLQGILVCPPAQRITYQQVFAEHVGVCPLSGEMEELRMKAQHFGFADIAEHEQDRDTLLQLLFSMVVEPAIGQTAPVFVYDFPASQAALARVSADDLRVAERFEVYFKGIELANGFHELDDPHEQLRRFEADNEQRLQMGLAPQPIDYHLIQALEAGLPHCAGVALGVDRLVMLALRQSHIQDVIAFPFPNA